MVPSRMAFFGLVPPATLTQCSFHSAGEIEVLTSMSLSVGSNTAGSEALQVPGCDWIVRRSERIDVLNQPESTVMHLKLMYTHSCFNNLQEKPIPGWFCTHVSLSQARQAQVAQMRSESEALHSTVERLLQEKQDGA